MSSARLNIIYGVPLTEQLLEIAQEHTEAEIVDLGFETMYSGSANYTPGFCGVCLCRISEWADPTLASQLVLVPTPEQRAQAEAKITGLPDYLRTACGPVDTYIVWSSS